MPKPQSMASFVSNVPELTFQFIIDHRYHFRHLRNSIPLVLFISKCIYPAISQFDFVRR